jgi:hypothetical protein
MDIRPSCSAHSCCRTHLAVVLCGLKEARQIVMKGIEEISKIEECITFKSGCSDKRKIIRPKKIFDVSG